MSVLEKLLDYVSFDTKSDPACLTFPSTAKQKILASHLVTVMKEIGISDVYTDDYGYVYGTVKGARKSKKTIAFIAHMDTSPEISGENVKPRVIENYDGKDIVLNKEKNIVTAVKDFPNLTNHKGKTLVVTDGTTLLGADDKAGIAEILQACEDLLSSGDDFPTFKVAFTPDEEVGVGADHFDVKTFNCDYAYTVDGSDISEIEYENFNGASAKITVTGRSVHPGSAKNKMINASKLVMEFHSMLPYTQAPEHTEGYEGFFHLVDMKSDIENGELFYILRDHDKELLDKKKETLVKIADYMNEKYEMQVVSCDIKDSYSNMKEMILPHMYIIETAKKAMCENGVEPKILPIRGGTDGARLSYMGLPCPNLGTGGENFHGKHEFAVVEDMEKMKDIIITIIKNLK